MLFHTLRLSGLLSFGPDGIFGTASSWQPVQDKADYPHAC